MKTKYSGPILGILALCSDLHAESPSSITNSIIRYTVFSGSGPFATNGQFFIIPNKIGDGYELISISGDVVSSVGTYSYTKVSANTGSIIANDSQAGISINQTLDFASANGGTFNHSNSLGSQSGTFEFEHKFSPSELGTVKADGLYLTNESGSIDLSFRLQESSDLVSWTNLVPSSCTILDRIRLKVTPVSDFRFYRFTMD